MKRISAFVVCVLLLGLPARADTSGRLSGRVVFSWSGAPVANATITLQSPSARLDTKTDSKGFYVFVAVPPGTYSIYARLFGFSPVSAAGIAVGAGVSVTMPNLAVRKLYIISEDFHPRDRLVRSGDTASITRISPTANPQYEGFGTTWLILRVPGVTPGPGNVAMP